MLAPVLCAETGSNEISKIDDDVLFTAEARLAQISSALESSLRWTPAPLASSTSTSIAATTRLSGSQATREEAFNCAKALWGDS